MKLSSKFRLAHAACAVVNLILAIPLSIEVFGEIRPEVIQPLAGAMLFFLTAGMLCAFGRLAASRNEQTGGTKNGS